MGRRRSLRPIASVGEKRILFEIVIGYDGAPSGGLVIEILIEAEAEEGAGYIEEIGETVPLQTHQSIVTSLGGAAVEVDRDIAGDLFHTLAQPA